jgi:hypothetical protein
MEISIEQYNKMAERLTELEWKLAEHEWISCSERLPDVDVEVLATVDWSDVRIAWLKKRRYLGNGRVYSQKR